MTLFNKVCAYCEEPFVTGLSRQRYCSKGHKQNFISNGHRTRAQAAQRVWAINGVEQVVTTWSEDEIAQLRADPTRVLPGRTTKACRQKACKLGLRIPRETRVEWTPEEIAQLRADPYARIKTRSTYAQLNKRKQLGLADPAKRISDKLWTEEEKALVEANPYAPVPGRTPRALYSKRVRMKLVVKRVPKPVQAPSKGSYKGAYRPNTVLGTASTRSPGFDLFSQLYKLAPRTDARDDVVSEAALLVLEGGHSVEEAVALAIKGVKRFNKSDFVATEFRDDWSVHQGHMYGEDTYAAG